jgi:hypothetical protein
MNTRPKSKFEDECGVINIWKYDEKTEYAEVKAWDKEYANECSRLSEIKAAKSGKRHWGRWVLSETEPISLDGIQVIPAVGNYPQRELEPYWIELSRIGPHGESDHGTYTWQEHLKGKNWISEKDLADFTIAIKELIQGQ